VSLNLTELKDLMETIDGKLAELKVVKKEEKHRIKNLK